jgi:predicted amidohydrolase
MRALRVSLLQMRSGLDPAANRAAAGALLREAAAGGARLVLTPEMTHRLDKDRSRLLAALEHEDAAAELRAWGMLAREHGVWLLLGSLPMAAGAGRIRNRSVLFDPKGQAAAHYDKINLFDVVLSASESYRESATVEAGAQAVTAAAAGGVKLGLTICYDLRFPELYRALAQAGAELIAVPSAFTRPTGEAHWEVLLRARAIENGAFLLAPAQGGRHEDGRATWGRSMIVGPWGQVLAKLDHDMPGVLTADLDLDEVQAAREAIPAWRGGGRFEGPA